MAKAHGAVNLVAGVWPLVHPRSFEAVFGPKRDRWLVSTVAGLLASVGYAQWRAGSDGDWREARRLGVGTATTLLLVDLVNVPRGRIRWTYLIDAAAEAALLAGWLSVAVSPTGPRQ
jgi:hypothetical protein